MNTKLKIKFVGVNDAGWNCYVTPKGTYIADINGDLYTLNQYEPEGLVGINGEPYLRLDKSKIEMVNEEGGAE